MSASSSVFEQQRGCVAQIHQHDGIGHRRFGDIDAHFSDDYGSIGRRFFLIDISAIENGVGSLFRLQRMRRRNGARRWALLRDAADPEVWIERFETPTWLDHLRVRERMTVIDREVEDRILTYHQGEGPPFARYLLAHVNPDSGNLAG